MAKVGVPKGERVVSLKVLAEDLKLSPATISLVVNNAPGASSIAEKTRARVMEAVRRLDYRPNTIARSLRTRQTFTVGVLVAEAGDGAFVEMMRGVEEELMRTGYLSFVVSDGGDAVRRAECVARLLNRSVDGLLVVGPGMVEEVRQPVVAMGEGVDEAKAAMLVMEHLQGLGHRRIVLVRAAEDARWEGMMKAAKAMGIAVVAELCGGTATEGFGVARELLGRTREFTAVVCCSDAVAMGVLRALADEGVRCPEDVSVVGMEDVAGGELVVPRLTVVRRPLREMGAAAARALLGRIAGAEVERVVFEPELVVRESTGVARR